MGRLWNEYDGEPWLDNPRLFMLNPSKLKRTRKPRLKKGRKAMAKRRRRMSALQRKYFGKGHSRVRRRRAALSNPHRRRRRRSLSLNRMPRRRRRSVLGNPRRRRHYRRNPISVAGLNMQELLTGGGAVILEPIIERKLWTTIAGSFPSLAASPYGPLVVKAATSFGLWYAAHKYMGRRTGDVVAIALGSALIANAVATLAPNFLSGLGAYGPVLQQGRRVGMGMRGYMPRGRQLGLVTPGQVTGNLAVTGSTETGIFARPF